MTDEPRSDAERSRQNRWPIPQYRLRQVIGAVTLVAINCGMLVVVRSASPIPLLLVLFGVGLAAIATVLFSASHVAAARGISLGFLAGLVAMGIAVCRRGYMPVLLLVGGPKPQNEIHSFAATIIGGTALIAGFALFVGIVFGIVRCFFVGHRVASFIATVLLVAWILLWNIAVSVRSIGPMGPGNDAAFPHEKITEVPAELDSATGQHVHRQVIRRRLL